MVCEYLYMLKYHYTYKSQKVNRAKDKNKKKEVS